MAQDVQRGEKKTQTEAHVGLDDQSAWGGRGEADFGVSATRRSNINIVDLRKTGIERMKPQRDLGIL